MRAIAQQLRPAVGDFTWTLVLGGFGAIVVALALQYSVQATCGLVLVVLVFALYLHDRTTGIVALFALWFLAPEVRRLLETYTGFLNNDPLSVAPFVATIGLAGYELSQRALPQRVRRILLMIAAGFAFGLPLGALHPSAALYAFIAYIAGVSGAVLGYAEIDSSTQHILRRVLLFVITPVAVYGLIQHVAGLPSWDDSWLKATGVNSIGSSSNGSVRVFSTLNAPGALAPLLGMTLLYFLTVRGHRSLATIAFVVIAVVLALTYVRSAWLSLIVAGVVHVVATRGESARPVLGTAAMAVAVTLVLSPVSGTARDVVNRFNTIGQPGSDVSVSARTATFGDTLPRAVTAPLGHGLGTAGEPTKLTADTTFRAPDNGYLSLVYQVGPIGFLLVVAGMAPMLQAAWWGARTPGPGQQMRLVVLAAFVFLVVDLASGDEFYGSLGVILWYLGGQALAFEYAQRFRKPAIVSS